MRLSSFRYKRRIESSREDSQFASVLLFNKMRTIKCILATLCLATITCCDEAASANYVQLNNSEIVAEVIQEVIEATRSGIVDVEKRTGDIVRSLQENVVDVIYEGRESLFALKEELRTKYEESEMLAKCDSNLVKELKAFEGDIKAKLAECAGTVFEYSESYRRKIRDDIAEIESGLNTVKTTDNCFGGQSDSRKCWDDQIIEYRRMSREISSGFDDIYSEAKENAIEVLNDLMECNKAAIKEAKTKQKSLKEQLNKC